MKLMQIIKPIIMMIQKKENLVKNYFGYRLSKSITIFNLFTVSRIVPCQCKVEMPPVNAK